MTTQTVTKTFECELEAPSRAVYYCNVEAHSKCYYHPGRTSGPPEDCYPAESDQDTTVEILDCIDEAGVSLQLTPGLLALLEPLLPFDWMEDQLWRLFLEGPED